VSADKVPPARPAAAEPGTAGPGSAETAAAEPSTAGPGTAETAAASTPDLPPPTMPAEARTGTPPPAPPRASSVRADGDRAAGGIPPGTGPEVPAAEGTAEAAEVAPDPHQPEVDEDAPPLASRPLAARGPRQLGTP
jgi:hypothetical protein